MVPGIWAAGYTQKMHAKNGKKIDGHDLPGNGWAMPAMSRGVSIIRFPLGFFGYPKEGNYIGIVGNFKSGGFTKALF